MFAKGLARSALAAKSVIDATQVGGAVPKRNAVNLSAIKMRIRATKNVSKITNVMKLVASSKLRGVEEQLNKGRVFGESIFNAIALPVKKKEKAVKAVGGAPGADDDKAHNLFEDNTKKHVCLMITTDRGLCGAVNSSLSRALRRELLVATKAKTDLRIITVGDKGRAQIARDNMPMMARALDNCFDKDPVFPLAAAVAAKVVAEPYDLLTLWYNHYENQAKYHNNYRQIPQLAGGKLPASLSNYEVEPQDNSETIMNLQEYGVAAAVFYAMLETVACETSQRVLAMDNATENAGEMVHGLSLIYNRGRQAKITTELSEIIGGASAAEVVAVD